MAGREWRSGDLHGCLVMLKLRDRGEGRLQLRSQR
jgi:hypothetical protein